MPSSMDDVARLAGVSKSTVSLTLNGKPGVSREVQERVLRAAAKLQYRLPKNSTSIRLPANQTLTVVHCYYNREMEYAGPEPAGLFLKYLNGIQKFVREQSDLNLNVITGYREGDASHLGYHLLEGSEQNLDGIILMGGGIRHNSHLVQRIITTGIPAVALSRNWTHLPISTVGQDHVEQAQIALNHLIELGHRRIAFIARATDKEYDWYEPRLRVYSETLAAHNGSVNPDWVALDNNIARAVRNVLARCPELTAIFALNDGRGIDVLLALNKLGVRVPQDLSLIGLDESVPAPSRHPQLTTVTYPHVKVGYLAADLLQNLIRQEDLYYANLLLRSYLVPGETCSTPRTGALSLSAGNRSV